MRKEKQDRLKERVNSSKAIVDNTKALEEKRKNKQEDFKRYLNENKNHYQEELARRLQRVYNKPLMVETVTAKVDKLSVNKNMQDKLNEYLNEEQESDLKKESSNYEKVDNTNEEDYKFDEL